MVQRLITPLLHLSARPRQVSLWLKKRRKPPVVKGPGRRVIEQHTKAVLKQYGGIVRKLSYE